MHLRRFERTQSDLTRLLRGPIFILFVLATSRRSAAQQAVLELDPAHTEINFTLAATLHTAHGTFKLKNGIVRFDPSTGAASGLITVDATTGETGNRGRDHKMHRQILESDRYPEISFRPVRVEGQVAAEGESHINVQGVMRLHGTEHETSLGVRVQVSGERANIEAHLAIPYVQWGLKDPSTFLLRVSDKLELYAHGTGRLTGLPALTR